MSSTISTPVYNGVTIASTTNPATYNYASPLTITSGGTVEVSGVTNAVYGLDGVTLINAGQITNSFSTGNAVDFSGGGVIVNSGSIGGTGNEGTGINLVAGGSVTNTAAGSISGNAVAVSLYNQPGTVSNAGSLVGTLFQGVYLAAGGVLTNSATGYIFGGKEGVYGTNQPGTVLNAGNIQGDREGVFMTAGGYVGNSAGGTIQGPDQGVYIAGQSGTVLNAGNIQGSLLEGVFMTAGGYVGNSAAGTIQGPDEGVYISNQSGTVVNAGTIAGTDRIGVYLAAGGTVIDSGTISGANGTAVKLGGAGGNLLALEHGYQLNDAVSVAGSNNTLELLGANGNLTVDLNGGAAGLTNFGTVAFGANGGNDLTLKIDGNVMPSNTISGFGSGDTIDLTGVASGLITNGTIDSGNVLTVHAAGNYSLHFDPIQSFAGEFFHTAPDNGGNGTLITESNTPCFCRGTMILTEKGQTAVEALKIGDKVMTLAGEAKPITWIGHGRRILTGENPEARPLIVRADAIAVGVPLRDLYLTRGHSLYLDGVLVPVEFLVNERTILWDDGATEVEFYHIELADHDVLLAEGAPAESYRDDGNRRLFDNPEPPVFAAANMAHYAPVLTGGPEINHIWRQLLDRSGFVEPETTEDPDLHLIADGERIDAHAVNCRAYGYQGIYRFRLERAPMELIIGSRAAVPMRLGLNHDPRCLGVGIRSIALRDPSCALDLDYESPWLGDGFNRPEPELGHRWTDGAAWLPGAALALFGGAFELSIDVGCTTRYPLAGPRPAMQEAPSEATRLSSAAAA